MVTRAGGRTLGRNSPVWTAQVSSPLNFDFHCRGQKNKREKRSLLQSSPRGCLYNAGFWKSEGGALAAGGNI